MEWVGSFEVPGSGNAVAGRLIVGDERSELTVIAPLGPSRAGELLDSDSPQNLPLVRGVTTEGTPVTAVDLTPVGESWHSRAGSAWTVETWIPGYVVEAHFDSEDRPTFTGASLSLTYLSSWLGSPLPKTQATENSFALEVETRTLAKATHQVGSYDFSGRAGTTSGFDATSLDFPAVALVEPALPVELGELVESMITPLEALLWVATGRFSDTDLHVRLDGDTSVFAKVWVPWIRPSAHEPQKRRLIGQEMLFQAEELPGGIEEGLPRWLDVWPVLRDALGPVIARDRAPFSYTDDRFASAIAGLEAYSLLRHGEYQMSREERALRVAAIAKAVERDKPEYLEWLLEALGQAHRHTLRSRLNKTLDEAGELGSTLLGEAREKFIGAVIKSRNQVAHSLPRQGGLPGGAAMHWASRGFSWLLRYLAMNELGFAPDASRDRVLASHTFRQEADLLQGALMSDAPALSPDEEEFPAANP
ncbi:MAG: HEPN domain-containing protein [Acidimicrobiia bacterium]